jgi:hypothetical protein
MERVVLEAVGMEKDLEIADCVNYTSYGWINPIKKPAMQAIFNDKSISSF